MDFGIPDLGWCTLIHNTIDALVIIGLVVWVGQNFQANLHPSDPASWETK